MWPQSVTVSLCRVEWWIKKFDEDPLAFSNVEDEQQVEGDGYMNISA